MSDRKGNDCCLGDVIEGDIQETVRWFRLNIWKSASYL
jgi:hypothetical protein